MCIGQTINFSIHIVTIVDVLYVMSLQLCTSEIGDTCISLLSGEPVELRFSEEVSEFLVEQGKKFSMSFECVDAEGKVVSLGKIVVTHCDIHTHMHTHTLTLTHTVIHTCHKNSIPFAESGRLFEVMAAVRKNVTPRVSRSKSRLHQMNSQVLPDLPEIQVPL